MLDNKGSLYIIEGIIAIIIVLMVFLVVNTAISTPNHDYSYESKNIRTAQDIMEVLSGKIDFYDVSFFEEISNILKDNDNSKESVRQISIICKNKLNSYNLDNYQLTENNILKGKVLVSKGDYKKASSVDVATRTYGDYYYTLSVW